MASSASRLVIAVRISSVMMGGMGTGLVIAPMDLQDRDVINVLMDTIW